MKLNELEKGTIFTIGETPSYPKIRTDYGYLDMRDKTRKICNNFDIQWDIRIIEKEELVKQFDATIEEIDDWLKELAPMI